jgi:hypothetical protein
VDEERAEAESISIYSTCVSVCVRACLYPPLRGSPGESPHGQVPLVFTPDFFLRFSPEGENLGKSGFGRTPLKPTQITHTHNHTHTHPHPPTPPTHLHFQLGVAFLLVYQQLPTIKINKGQSQSLCRVLILGY